MKNSKPIEGHFSNQRQPKKMQTSECEYGNQDIVKCIALICRREKKKTRTYNRFKTTAISVF